jgi:hypothetical protein
MRLVGGLMKLILTVALSPGDFHVMRMHPSGAVWLDVVSGGVGVEAMEVGIRVSWL